MSPSGRFGPGHLAIDIVRSRKSAPAGNPSDHGRKGHSPVTAPAGWHPRIPSATGGEIMSEGLRTSNPPRTCEGRLADDRQQAYATSR